MMKKLSISRFWTSGRPDLWSRSRLTKKNAIANRPSSASPHTRVATRTFLRRASWSVSPTMVGNPFTISPRALVVAHHLEKNRLEGGTARGHLVELEPSLHDPARHLGKRSLVRHPHPERAVPLGDVLPEALEALDDLG